LTIAGPLIVTNPFTASLFDDDTANVELNVLFGVDGVDVVVDTDRSEDEQISRPSCFHVNQTYERRIVRRNRKTLLTRIHDLIS
jgi:hypothetical protein